MNRENIVYNLMWRFAERCGAQIVQLIVSIVLARLLAPTDYGIIAMMNVFISIMDVFVSCGLNGALIQKKDADEVDCFFVLFYILYYFFQHRIFLVFMKCRK